MKKAISILLISLACLSLVLPFQEFKSLWADFTPTGNLFKDDISANHVIRGGEFLLPYLVVVVILINHYLSSFRHGIRAKSYGLIIGSVNLLLVAYLFLLLRNPAEALPNSMFRPPIPIVGTGYFLLLMTVLGTLLLSFFSYVKANR